MYKAPEILHLERAVKAVKDALLPEKQTQPPPESEPDAETEHEPEEQEPQR